MKISDTEYEVSLRDDAKFSDGTDVTADDVVESYARATAEGNLYGSMLDFIDDITAKDDKTVTVSLSRPFGLNLLTDLKNDLVWAWCSFRMTSKRFDTFPTRYSS